MGRANVPTPELAALREKAIDEGTRLAGRIFEKRGNHSEVHLDRNTLAAALAVAFEAGYSAARAPTNG